MDSPENIEEVRHKRVLVRHYGKYRKGTIVGGGSSLCQVRITATNQLTAYPWRKIFLNEEKEKKPLGSLTDFLRRHFK